MAELNMVMGTLATSRQDATTTFEKQKNESDRKVTQTLRSAQNIPLDYNYKNLQQDQIAEESSEQQTSSMVRSGLLDTVGADLINKFSKFSQSIVSSLKMMTAIEKQDTTKKLAVIDGVTEGLQRISEKPREIDLGDKNEPEEKGFMTTLKEKIVSTVGIAGDVLFGSKSFLTAGIGRMIASPVGAGIAAGVGIAGVAAGVGMVAGSNAPGVFRPEWFEGLNKSKHSNEELAEKLSKYWQKHGGPNDTEKMSWFIGSVVGESSLKSVREYAPKGVDARAYFNKKYGKERKVGRKLGNTNPDDGYKFRGGGILQITGRGNYTKIAKEMGLSGPDELSDRITEFDISLEAAVVYFLKRPGHSEPPVKASSYEGALSRIGYLPSKRERTVRAKGRETFLKNVAKYPVTATPDYNNGYTSTNISPQSGGGTRGDGRYHIDREWMKKTSFSRTPMDDEILKNISLVNSSEGNKTIYGLQPPIKSKLLELAKFYLNATGTKLPVTAGWRSHETQMKLYKRFGPSRAAKPGTSPHESGEAIDAGRKPLDDIGDRLLNYFGFIRPIKTDAERQHMEQINHRLSAITNGGWNKPGSQKLISYAKKININIF